MFCFLFGWRKASKCKKLIRRVQCRLKLLKNKRESILKQSRDDIVQLIKNGKDQIAFARVGQLFKDQCIKDVYEMIDNFCEFIVFQLPYIRTHRDCPNDISEAISSLLFASARCGNLPELKKMRELFASRYGHKYVMTAVELLPGNLVNYQIIEKVGMESISDDTKFRLMKEIARDNNLQLRPPSIESLELQCQEEYDTPLLQNGGLEWGKQVSDKDIQSAHYDIEGAQLQNVEKTETQGNNAESSYSNQLSIPILLHKVERIKGASWGSSSKISEKSIVYLDDVEEFQRSIKEDGSDKDQRLFTFKLTIPQLGNKGHDHGTDRESSSDSCDPSDGKKTTRRAIKTRKSARKRNKRRYVLKGRQIYNSSISLTLGVNDAECALYYGENRDTSPEDHISSRPHHRRNHHREKQNRGSSSVEGCCECCLDLPCYFFTGKDEDDWKSSETNWWRKDYSGCKAISNNMKHQNLRVRRDYKDADVVYPAFTSQNQRQYDQTEVEELEISDYRATYASSCGSCSTAMSPWTHQIKAWPPSPNSVILPPEQHKGTISNHYLWSSASSCQFQLRSNSNRSSSSSSSSHVHPKLPDYDDLVTKFRALRLEHLQSSVVNLAIAG